MNIIKEIKKYSLDKLTISIGIMFVCVAFIMGFMLLNIIFGVDFLLEYQNYLHIVLAVLVINAFYIGFYFFILLLKECKK